MHLLMNRILRNCNNCYIDADQKNDDDVVVVVCLSVSNDFGFYWLDVQSKTRSKDEFQNQSVNDERKAVLRAEKHIGTISATLGRDNHNMGNWWRKESCMNKTHHQKHLQRKKKCVSNKKKTK